MTTQVFYYSDPACPSTRFQIADLKKDIFFTLQQLRSHSHYGFFGGA